MRSPLSVLVRAATGATLATIALAALMPSCAHAAEAPRDVAAWVASPDQAGPPARAGTLRQVVRAGVAGGAVRVRLSNLFGRTPLVMAHVHVALQSTGPSTRPGSDRALTFDGREGVTIPPGESRLSDAAPIAVAAGEAVTVSLWLPVDVPVSTIHGVGLTTVWIVPGSDATAATTLPRDAGTDDSRWFLTELDVRADASPASPASPAPRALVVLGDSISDGVGSTPDTDGRWTDRLGERLRATQGLADVAVLDAGIAGNRLRRPGADPYVGPSALDRLDRDALDLPGVRAVLLFEGCNDISASDALADPAERASAAQVIDAMKAIAARVHARGLKAWAATLLPRGGSVKFLPHTPAAEEKRQAVNAWIRSAPDFDVVVDLDRALRDPAQPDRLRPDLDSGDHTHPNDAGHRALAEAVDLERLRTGL